MDGEEEEEDAARDQVKMNGYWDMWVAPEIRARERPGNLFSIPNSFQWQRAAGRRRTREEFA